MLPNARLCNTNAEKWFKGVWSSECKENRKLRYYSHIKKDIGLEPYVAHCRHDITRPWQDSEQALTDWMWKQADMAISH